MSNETVAYIDALINRKYHETQDLKYPELDVKFKAIRDIKAGEVFHTALFKKVQENVTGGVAYSASVRRENKQNNNNNNEGETF